MTLTSLRPHRAWIAALVVALAGCAVVRDINVVPEADEIELGRQVAAEVEQTQTLHPDARLQQYVENIGLRLAARSSRPGLPWRIRVIDDDQTVNAFAAPGGYLYVYSGLLLACDDEAMLAGVMGHEVAHVDAHHQVEQLTRAYGLSVVAAVVLGEDPGMASRIAADLTANATLLKFGRDAEREADMIGLRLMTAEGWDPEGMADFFDKLADLSGREPSAVEVFFSSHPPSTERRDAIRQAARDLGLVGGDRHRERYQREITRALGSQRF